MPGLRTSNAEAASTMASLDSASDWRPITTVTGPDGEQVARGGQGAGVDAAGVGSRWRSVEQGAHRGAGLPGSGEQRDRRQRGHTRRVRCHLDDPYAVAHDRVAQSQEEDGKLLFEVGPEQQHGAAGRAHLVDGGPREPEHQLGGQAVAQLGVDVVGADDALDQLGPGVGGLVGEPGAADHAHPSRRAPHGWPWRPAPPRRSNGRRRARRRRAPAARSDDRRCAGPRSRSAPCRRASPSSPGRCRRPGSAAPGCATTRPRCGSRPSTPDRSTRPTRGPRAGPGTGTRWRSARRPDRSARCCR